jgi:hypothetical protein
VKRQVSGLYAVTPDVADTPGLLATAEAALAGGARLLQYRNKSASSDLRLAQARALLTLCRGFQVALIINDHLDLALAVNADGLHLGAEDDSLTAARARLGPEKILGVSCYDQLERAREIGVLRAQGLTPRQVWGLTAAQTGFMGLVAGLLALPVGGALALVLIFVINRRSFGWTLQLEITPALLVQAVLLAVAAALLAAVYPAWRMSTMPLPAALTFEMGLTARLFTTADKAEGVRAFLEKRAARFEGR